MAGGFGGAIKLTGESEYRKALSQITNNYKTLTSEMKVNASTFDKNDKSVETLNAKQEMLNKTLSKQKEALKQATSSYNSFKTEVDKQAKAHNELEKEYQDSVKELEKLKNTSGETSKEYQDQAKKVEQLKKQYDDSNKAQVQNEKGLTNLKVAMDKAQVSVNKTSNDLNGLEKELKEGEKATKEASDGFTVMKGVMADLVSKGIQKVAEGFKKMISSAIEAYEEYDNGADIIIQKTGATGEAAESLAKSYKNVSKSVVGSFDDIGTAIGEVNTRFGVTGKDLEDLSTKFLKFAELNGTDVNSSIDSVQKTLAAFGLEGEEAGNVLDTLNKVGQDTGISMDTLSSLLMENANTFSQMGLDVHQAAVFLGNVEKSGVSTSTAMTSLAKASQYAVNEGKPLTEVLKETQDKMKNAKTDTEALEIAYDVFGKKAGGKIYEACKKGSLSFDDLSKAMENNAGSIDNTYEATQDGMDKIKLSIQGARAEIGETVGKLLDENKGAVQKVIKEATEIIKGFFNFIVNNGGTIISVVQGIGASFAVFKIGTLISSLVGTFTTFFNTVKAGTGIMQALNLTMTANPYVLLATAIVGVGVALVGMAKNAERAIEKEYGLSEAQKELIEKSQELADEYDELAKSRNEINDSVESEFGYIDSLKEEYNGLIDSNGQVKKGYEDRANFIKNQLAKSLGIEVSELENLIDKNGQLGTAIDKVIEKKKAQVLLDAQEDNYKKAIEGQREALINLQKSQESVNEAKAKYKKAQQEAEPVMKNYEKLLKTNSDEAMNYYRANKDVIDGLYTAELAYKDAENGLKQNKKTYLDYQRTIQNYEGLSSAIISGDTEKISKALMYMQNDFIKAENGTKKSLENQVKNAKENLRLLEQAIKDGTPGVTQEMVDQAKTMVNESEKELDKFQSKAEKSTKKSMDKAADGIKSKKGTVKKAAEDVGKAEVDGLDNGSKQSKNKGAKASTDFAAGIKSKTNTVKTEAKSMAQKGKDEAAKVKTKDTGENFGKGFSSGISSMIRSVRDAAGNLASTAKNKLKSILGIRSPSRVAKEYGQFFTQGFAIGIEDMTSQAENATTKLVHDTLNSLGNAQAFNDVAKNNSIGYMNGLKANISDLNGMMNNGMSIPKISVESPKNSFNDNENMISAFKEALSQMKIELDDEELGTFVDKTITRLVYK